MFNSILFSQVANFAILIILILIIGIQWIIFFGDTILSKLGIHSSSKQITKIPIISGITSPETISKSLQETNASDPSADNYLQIIPSYNQSQGLEFSLSFWLNVSSQQQSSNVANKIIFYKGSVTKTKKLQFINPLGLFHIDVSITSQNDSKSSSKTYTAKFSYPNDSLVLSFINLLTRKKNPAKFIYLIFDLANPYQVSYNSSDQSITLSNPINSSKSVDLSSFKVLKFAAFNTQPSQKSFRYDYDYAYKTPLLKFGNSVNDLILELNDINNIDSHYFYLFNKDKQAYTLNLNKFVHIVITISDHLESSKPTGTTDVKTYIDGKIINQQPLPFHVHFNYGNFYVFPTDSSDYVISSKHSDLPLVQIADLTYYRQALNAGTILSLFKAGYTKTTAAAKSTKKATGDDKVALSTQNYNY